MKQKFSLKLEYQTYDEMNNMLRNANSCDECVRVVTLSALALQLKVL